MANNLEIKTIRDLPSPPSIPVLGHIHHLKGKNVHDVIAKWAEEVGTLFSINLMGKDFIVSADPEVNHKIMRSRPDKFRRYYKINEIMSEMGLIGVFNAEGDQWKVHRKHFSEALSVKNVQGYFHTLDHVTAKLLNRLRNLSQSEEALDIKQEMVRYAVDITTGIAFGHNVNTLENNDDEIQRHFDDIFPMLYKRIVALFPTWRFFKFKHDHILDKALLEVEVEMQHLIELGKKQLANDSGLVENPANFLQALLVEQMNNPTFTDKEVYGNVFSMLVGGEDTTANSISWVLYYLAMHPKIVEKARSEAVQVYNTDSFPRSVEQLEQLTYTNAIITETLRIKPVTSTIYLQALEDTVIDDLEVRKGMTFILQNREAQISDLYFTDAHSFIPERWLPEACPAHDKHSPEVMRAFGGGARYCPGAHLATQEMKMAVSMICKNFDLSLAVEPEDVKETFSFTMAPDNLLIRFEMRQ